MCIALAVNYRNPTPSCYKSVSIYYATESDIDTFTTLSKIYNKLGFHNYKTNDPENIKEYICSNYCGNKSIYIGQLKDGTNQREGVGICVWDNGFIAEGEWKNDMLDGYGRHIWTNGAYYIGEYKEDWRHGYGEYYYNNGDVYKGNWEGGFMKGQGTMTCNDGTVKSGLWKDGKFQE